LIMNYGGDRDHNTICAVSTPAGYGGVAIIRVSGPQSLNIVSKLASFLPEHPESHKIYFGTLTSVLGEMIDEVLILFFQQGKSYTSEQTVEISCHGSPAVSQWILQELISCGARIADRGEFSYRAFINGNIDLVQAEGVLELIESQSRRSAQQGLRQLKGGLSKELRTIENNLLYVLANIEAAIDFSTEDIDVINKEELQKRTSATEASLSKLINSYQSGRVISEGLHVALLGEPNIGKSSLFNLLLGEERSIVTEVAGTTRDVVESSLMVSGVRVVFMDTAGIRKSTDVVEKIGIQRSLESQTSADLVFFLFDGNKGLSDGDLQILKDVDLTKLVLIGNKTDLVNIPEVERRTRVQHQLVAGKFFKNPELVGEFLKTRVFFGSTLEHTFRSLIFGCLEQQVSKDSFEDEAVVSQARHFDNLSKALELTKAASKAFSKDFSADVEFVALDLKSALICIQETLGERFDDQIMDFVFKQFCIGK